MVTVYVDDDLILFAITDSKSSSHGLLADSYYRKLDNMKRRKESGLCQTWSETLDIGFLMTRLICSKLLLLALMLGVKLDEGEVKERFEVACLLIKNGANVNAMNKRGRTPLQCCSNDSLRNAVRQFIQRQSPKATNPAASLFGELFAALTNICSVCSQRQSDVTFLPCRHKVTCERCCFRVRECPLCDQMIRERFSDEGKRLVLMEDPCKVQ